MASRGIDIGVDLVNLATDADLDLSEATNYSLQNKSDYRLWLYEYDGAGTPVKGSSVTRKARSFVEAWDSAIINIASGNSFFAWYDGDDGGTISVVEAP